MDNYRSINGARNIFFGVINKIVLMILPFTIRTVMVKVLGSDYLGLNGLVTSVLMVLNLAELGIGDALVYSMYKPMAEKNVRQVSSLLRLYRTIYRCIGGLILGVGIILTPFIPKLINGEWPGEVNIYVVYIIYLANTSISYLLFAYKKALLVAAQRNDIISNANTILSVFMYLGQIGILLYSKNYYLYIITYPIVTLLDNIICARNATKLFNIRCEGIVGKGEKKEIFTHVKGIALQKICSSSRNTFDSIVISMYLGLIPLSIYNNYFYILNAIHVLTYQIPNAIRSTIGNSVVQESKEKNLRDFGIISFIYAWISAVCMVCLLCLYQPFMKIWMGTELMLPLGTMILFAIYFLELNLTDVIGVYRDAAGLWWQGRYRTVLEAVANLVLNFMLGYIWGINGVLLATIITTIIFSVGYAGYIVFKYYFGIEQLRKYYLEIGKYILSVGIIAFIVYRLCMLPRVEGWVAILVKGMVCFIGTNFSLWFCYRKSQNYRNAKMFIGQILKVCFSAS